MSSRLAVVLQRRAGREFDDIDRWWRENRPAAPDLFLKEFTGTMSLLALMPGLGARGRSERVRDVRRVLLTRTRYHVYYRVRGGTIEVLAVWHTARGTGPGL